MADACVRGLERRYCSTRDANDGLALAVAQRRAGQHDAAFRTLSDLISDNSRDAGTHEQAIVAFRALLGDCYVDGSDPRYPGRWVLGYVAPGLAGSVPEARRFIVEDLDKDLLDGGRRHSQAELRVLAQANGRQLQSLPEYMDGGIALYGAQESENEVLRSRVEAVRGALEVGMKMFQILDSQTLWTPGAAPDRFYPHGVGVQGTELVLAGPRDVLTALPDMAATSGVVFGTGDIAAVNRSLDWIGQRDSTYMWRFEEQEKANLGAEEERVVGLVVDGIVVVFLYGDVFGDDGGVARGWLRRCTRNFFSDEH